MPTVPINSILESSINTIRIRSAAQKISRRNQWRLFKMTLIISDILMLAIAGLLAYNIRFVYPISLFKSGIIPSIEFYRLIVTILIPIWLLIFFLNGLYDRTKLLGGTQEYSLVFRGTTAGMLILIIGGFLDPDFIFARGWLLLFWGFSFLLVSSARFWLRRGVYRLRRYGYFTSNALIVGANEEGYSIAEQVNSWYKSGLFVLGFVDDNIVSGSRVYGRFYNLGDIEELENLIRVHNIEDIILTASALPRKTMILLFKRYGVTSDVNLRLSSGLFEILTTGLELSDVGYTPLVGINRARLTGYDRVMKIALDYVIAFLAMFIMSFVYAAIALAIKYDSPGPVIYRRRVMGQNGVQFNAFKFRTMYINGDEILAAHPELKEELERTHKLKNDPRITRVGNVLRRLSLDELPQLINVIRGEMSVVGPRMITPEERRMYEQWDMNLLTVKPGLTGLWQVSGRSDTSYEERVRLDMQYIRNWTIWSDLYLLWRTLPAVLKSRGAY
jgi:exopolysaccharide biosynthesis polyprenyl glycosylphosphotransferase